MTFVPCDGYPFLGGTYVPVRSRVRPAACSRWRDEKTTATDTTQTLERGTHFHLAGNVRVTLLRQPVFKRHIDVRSEKRFVVYGVHATAVSSVYGQRHVGPVSDLECPTLVPALPRCSRCDDNVDGCDPIRLPPVWVVEDCVGDKSS